jgi:hypothetical protein
MRKWFSFKQYRIFISLFLGTLFWFLIQFLLSRLVQGYKFRITSEEFSWGLSLIFSVYIFLWIHNKITKFDTWSDFRDDIKNYWNEGILGREPREKHNKQKKDNEIIYDKDYATKAFDTILQLRDLDNTLMWNRINLLLVFQGVLIAAVAAGINDLSTEKYSLLFATIIIFGLFSSLMLFNIARGGSWWVSHWEKHLAKIEPTVVGNIDIFREHISNKPELKRIWKKEGYVSTRDTIIHFTSVFPLIWTIILLIFLAGFS